MVKLNVQAVGPESVALNLAFEPLEADSKMQRLAAAAAKTEAVAAAQAEVAATAKTDADADKMRHLASGAARAEAVAAAQAQAAPEEAVASGSQSQGFFENVEEVEEAEEVKEVEEVKEAEEVEGGSRQVPLAALLSEGSSEAFEVIEPMAVSDGLTVAPASRDVKERAPSAVDRVREAAKVAAGTAGEATGWAARKSSEIMPSRADLGEAASAAKALASSTTAEATSVVAEWWGYMRGSAPAAAPPAAAQ